jgi:hypothetical protein
VLGYLDDEVLLPGINAGVGDLDRPEDGGKLSAAEFQIYHRSDDLDNLSNLDHGFPPNFYITTEDREKWSNSNLEPNSAQSLHRPEDTPTL